MNQRIVNIIELSKAKFGAIREKAMNIKVCANRSMSYFSMVNMALILYVALVNFRETRGITISGWLVIPLSIMMVLLFLGLGWAEVKLKFFSDEQKITALKNPVIVEMLNKLNSIEDKLTKLENKEKK